MGGLQSLADRLNGSLDYIPVAIFYTGTPKREERRYTQIRMDIGGEVFHVQDRRGSSQLLSDRDYGAVLIEPDSEGARILGEGLEDAAIEFESKPRPDVSNRKREAVKEEEYKVRPRNLENGMTILVVLQGEYGKRIYDWLNRRAPATWEVAMMTIPEDLPEVIDDSAPYLPSDIPPSDLVLFLSETSNAPQLVPDIVRASGAVAIIAPVDRSEWMPPGQVTQLKRAMLRWGVETSFPRPFCSLEPKGSEAIDRFAELFGKPVVEILTEDGKTVADVKVIRGAPCGCTHFVASNLQGEDLGYAVERSGLLHHHYPCLASMDREEDMDDTLMHLSGLILKKEVEGEVGKYLKKKVNYLDPRQFKR